LLPFPISGTSDLPVPHGGCTSANSRHDCSQCGHAHRQGSEPYRNRTEAVTHANADENCLNRFSLRSSTPWPAKQSNRRLSLSVERVNSEAGSGVTGNQVQQSSMPKKNPHFCGFFFGKAHLAVRFRMSSRLSL